MVGVFKKLYPEPKMVKLWQGQHVMIDWFYAYNEMFQMARMARWNGDIMSLATYLLKYDVEYEYEVPEEVLPYVPDA